MARLLLRKMCDLQCCFQKILTGLDIVLFNQGGKMKKNNILSIISRLIILIILWSIFFMFEDNIIPVADDYTAVELQMSDTEEPVQMRRNYERIISILRILMIAGTAAAFTPEIIRLFKNINKKN